MSLFENRIFYGLLALLVWLPLPVASNRPWAEGIFELWIAILAGFWIYGWQRRKLRVSNGFDVAIPVIFLLLAWLFFLVMQIIPLPADLTGWLTPEGLAMYRQAGVGGWSPVSLLPYSTFLFLLKSIAYTLVFMLTLLLINSKQRLVVLGYTLVFSAAFQAFYGSIMTLSGIEYGFFVEKTAYIGFATGTFINRNHLAGYIEMISAIGIGLLLATSANKAQGKQSWRKTLLNLTHLMLSQKFILRLMLAMLVIALVLTRSRMGNTGFFASLLITGFIALFAFRSQCSSFGNMLSRRETKSAVILIISLLLIDMFIVGAWFGVEKLTDRISQTSAEADAGRLDVAKRSIGLLKDYPLVGGGGGSFHTVYARYRSGEVKQYYDHAHQDYLEIIADVGGIGFSILALVVLLSLYTALRTLFRTRDLLLRGMSFASVMGIIALLIHSTVDFNLQIPANAATFMVVLALGWIASSLDRDLKKQSGFARQVIPEKAGITG